MTSPDPTVTREVIDRFTGRWAALSNFAPARITIPHLAGPLDCPTAEHAFNALKTLVPAAQLWVAAASTPSQAKARGRTVPLRDHWDERWRYTAMRWVLDRKFDRAEHAAVLEATGDAALIEGNRWHDQTWGCCRCGTRAECARPGHNLLGWMLTIRRDHGPQTNPDDGPWT